MLVFTPEADAVTLKGIIRIRQIDASAIIGRNANLPFDLDPQILIGTGNNSLSDKGRIKRKPSNRVLGFVTHVTQRVNGLTEIEFFDFERNVIVTLSNSRGGLPDKIASALADSLARNLWVKIEYERGKLSRVSFEEYNFQKDVYGLREKLEKVWKGYLERN
jgi:hypothetical protein